jgi:hypothetical protein
MMPPVLCEARIALWMRCAMVGCMAKKKPLLTIIANAIRKADSSYFFEDYGKQAAAVEKAIRAAGYRIVPQTLEKEAFKEIADNMRMGKMHPEQHVENLYATFLAYWEKPPR